jgi:hypothetical protein
MANPVQLIDILSRRTAAEALWCDDCKGTGEYSVFDPETGNDIIDCETCLGSGYNQLGLILQGILTPPEQGYGPVELREALSTYLAQVEQQKVLQEAQQSIHEAEEAIAKTQQLIDKTKAWMAERQVAPPSKADHPNQNAPKRRIS